jgi:hypothetical protein
MELTISYFNIYTFNFYLNAGLHCFDNESTYKMIVMHRAVNRKIPFVKTT